MGSLFHFPTEYGKIGNWPGMIGAEQSQLLLLEAASHKPGATFVELGFDGGRTTIVLNWAARQIGATIDVVSVRNDETGLWFKRACVLHRFDREKVKAHEELVPGVCDLLVINPAVPGSVPAVADWISLVNAGGSVVRLGGEGILCATDSDFKQKLVAPGIFIHERQANQQRVMDRVIDNVVSEFSENKTATPLDSHQRAKVHSLSRDKRRNGSAGSTDSKVHAPVEPDKSSELLPS